LCEFEELGLHHGIIATENHPLQFCIASVSKEGKTCLGFAGWWRHNRILVST
jgi:hypothetical protein